MESLRPQIAVNGTLTTTFKFSGGRNLMWLCSAAEQHLRRARHEKASRTRGSVLLFGAVLTNDDTCRSPDDSSTS